MLEGGRISEAELVTMLIYVQLGTAFFFLPSLVAGFAGRDAWLTPLIATLGGIAVAFVTGCLTIRFPGLNFFHWTEILLGRVGGKILQCFYVLFFIHSNVIIVNEFGYFIRIAFLPVTPPVMTIALLLFLTGVAAYGGVEIIGRLAIIFLPVSLAIFLAVIALSVGLNDFANLKPFLENGLTPVLVGSVVSGPWQTEIFLGAMLFPFLPRPERGGWVMCRGSLWTAPLLLVDTLSLIMTFGGDIARLSLPVYSVAQNISLLHFFEHLEGFVLISWVGGIFVKVALWNYVTVLGIAQWLEQKSYRHLVLPVGLLILAVANYDAPDIAILVHFAATVLPFYAVLFLLGVPAILAILSMLQKRGLQPRRVKRKAIPVTGKEAMPDPQPG